MGVFVDPRMQGKYLDLSPLIVLFSIVLWGWIWGIPGALLGVPITVGVVLTCGEFAQTEWVSKLLTTSEDDT